MIVADTNLIAYLLLEGEYTKEAEVVYQIDSDWIAPYLWRSEFRNILALYLRKDYLTLGQARQIIQKAESLLLGKEFEIESQQVLDLVASCQLSAYDCEYIVLAQQLGVNLVTADKKVLAQFPSVAISLKNYSS